jgi:hypothetical protein
MARLRRFDKTRVFGLRMIQPAPWRPGGDLDRHRQRFRLLELPIVLVLVAGVPAPCLGQTHYDAYRPYLELHERSVPVASEFTTTAVEPKVFGLTADEEWADLIDDTWGPGPHRGAGGRRGLADAA